MNLKQIKTSLESHWKTAGFSQKEDCTIAKPYWDGNKIKHSTEVWNNFCNKILHLVEHGMSINKAFRQECSNGGIKAHAINMDIMYGCNAPGCKIEEFYKICDEYSKYIKWDNSKEYEICSSSFGDVSRFLGLHQEVIKYTAEILTDAGFRTVVVDYNDFRNIEREIPKFIFYKATDIAWEELADEHIHSLEEDIMYTESFINVYEHSTIYNTDYFITLIDEYLSNNKDYHNIVNILKQENQKSNKTFVEYVSNKYPSVLLYLKKILQEEIERFKSTL